MNHTMRLFLALAGISLVSGVALGGLYEATHERAENNILKFKKIPAVVDIHRAFEGEIDEARGAALEVELLAEKRYVDTGDKKPMLMFVLKKQGKNAGVAIESYGQGFGGKLGVMVGIDTEDEKLLAIGITTMSETPGVGTRVRTEKFTDQFISMPKTAVYELKKAGGEIDAVSGATISSKAVAEAIRGARAIYTTHHEAIIKAATTPVSRPAAGGEK